MRGSKPHAEASRLAATLAKNLRALRRRAGWTQAELARRTQLTDELIGRLERGITSPTSDTLLRLALAFGVPIDAFYESRVHHLRWRGVVSVDCPSCGELAEIDIATSTLTCGACGGQWTIAAWERMPAATLGGEEEGSRYMKRLPRGGQKHALDAGMRVGDLKRLLANEDDERLIVVGMWVTDQFFKPISHGYRVLYMPAQIPEMGIGSEGAHRFRPHHGMAVPARDKEPDPDYWEGPLPPHVEPAFALFLLQ